MASEPVLVDQEKTDLLRVKLKRDNPRTPVYTGECLELSPDAESKYHNVENFIRQLFSEQLGSTKAFHDSDELSIKMLKGGITNMLLQGTYERQCRNEPESAIKLHFLIRTYGNGTDKLINRDREFSTHLHLYKLGLAPPLYSRFGNGLVYKFIPGRAIDYVNMSDSDIMKAVANRLAQWHSKLDSQAIDASIESLRATRKITKPFAHNMWDLLSEWIDVMPQGILEITSTALKEEIKWLRENIENTSPIVVSHCDLLSGNILVPDQWKSTLPLGKASIDYSDDQKSNEIYEPSQLVSFIDYEYAMPAARAFDMANHFMEWQGFECKTELIQKPSLTNPVLRYWVYHYLCALRSYENKKSHSRPTEKDIDGIMTEIITWWGIPGFYWGIWSAIQSTISDIDFDYADYAIKRMSEYFEWKKRYTASH